MTKPKRSRSDALTANQAKARSISIVDRAHADLAALKCSHIIVAHHGKYSQMAVHGETSHVSEMIGHVLADGDLQEAVFFAQIAALGRKRKGQLNDK